MTVWEHQVLVASNDNLALPPDAAQEWLQRALDERGREGWECVSIAAGGQWTVWAVMKRPVPVA
jgi:hypothetical protein